MRFHHTSETPALACWHARFVTPPRRCSSLAPSESVPRRTELSVPCDPGWPAAELWAQTEQARQGKAADAGSSPGKRTRAGCCHRGDRLLAGFGLSLAAGLRKGWNSCLGGGVATTAHNSEHGARVGRPGHHRHPSPHLLELEANRR